MRVLVVDDDGYSRKLIGFVLDEAGHTVLYAENGQEAIQIWEKEKPDLILMDLMMPVLDGFEAAVRIKDQAGQEFIPIVFMTALSEEKAMVRCLEVGDDFLVKPVNLVMLEAKIRAHARNIELNRQVLSQNQELAYFRAKVSAEFDMTQQIMKVALQNSQAYVEGVNVHCSPHSTFNGDLVLMHEKRDGGLYLLLGDFTGHGLASSIGSVPVAQTFQTLTERNMGVGVMAQEINRVLLRFLPRSMFFAMTLLELNTTRTLAEVWTGGLPDAFVINEDGELRRRLSSNHMPVGVLENHEFETLCEKVELAEGDRILLYTDGVNEASSPAGELFGERRLLEVLCAPTGVDLIEGTLAAVRAFMQSEEFQDDLSMVEVSCRPVAARDLVARKTGASIAGEDQEKLVQTSHDAFRLPAFKAEFHWLPEQLRETDPLFLVRQWIDQHLAIRGQKELVLSVLSEIFNNALDHGVLGLSSEDKEDPDGFMKYYEDRAVRLADLEAGFVQLELGFENELPMELSITIRDSGRGFDFEKVDWSDSEATFGRGLPLVQEICSHMSFEDEGATMRLRLPL